MKQNIFSCIGENVNFHGPLLLPFNNIDVANRCYKLFKMFTFLLAVSQINSTNNQESFNRALFKSVIAINRILLCSFATVYFSFDENFCERFGAQKYGFGG